MALPFDALVGKDPISPNRSTSSRASYLVPGPPPPIFNAYTAAL